MSEEDSNGLPANSPKLPAKTNEREDSTDVDVAQSLIPPGLLESLPEPVQKSVVKMMSVGMQMGGPPPEFLAKITSEHISDTIKQAGENSEREFRDANRARWFNLAHYCIGAVAVVYLAISLGPTSPGLLEKIFTWLVIAAGGVGIGIGKMSLRRK